VGKILSSRTGRALKRKGHENSGSWAKNDGKEGGGKGDWGGKKRGPQAGLLGNGEHGSEVQGRKGFRPAKKTCRALLGQTKSIRGTEERGAPGKKPVHIARMERGVGGGWRLRQKSLGKAQRYANPLIAEQQRKRFAHQKRGKAQRGRFVSYQSRKKARGWVT